MWNLGKEVFLIFTVKERLDLNGINPTHKTIDAHKDSTQEADAPSPSPQPPPKVCIRLHFGMSGSLHLNSSRPRSTRAVRLLHVAFEGGKSLSVYGGDEYGSCRMFDVQEAYFKARGPLEHLDVCGPAFDPVMAKRRVMEEEGKVVCVAIMDQVGSGKPVSRGGGEPSEDPLQIRRQLLEAETLRSSLRFPLPQNVLPGVGNIIKQESLHRARLHPLRKVSDISEDDIARLVEVIRWFSMEWLKVRLPYATPTLNRP